LLSQSEDVFWLLQVVQDCLEYGQVTET
jgi:hypothetical protein